MTDTNAGTITVTPEEIAEHLRWRLSNSNAELDLSEGMVDVAFDTSKDDGDLTVTLSVSSWNVEADSHGFQQFTLTVAAASSPETGDHQ